MENFSALHFLISLGASMVSAFVASRWTLRGALHQKLWERKEVAYREILEGVHELNLFYGVRAGLSRQLNLLDDEESMGLRRRKAIETLERSLSVHSWYVRPEVLGALRDVIYEEGRYPNRYRDEFDYAKRSGEINVALDELRDSAKLELARLGELDKALSVEALILRDRGQKVCTTDGANSGV
jgi:hypothetical protein